MLRENQLHTAISTITRNNSIVRQLCHVGVHVSCMNRLFNRRLVSKSTFNRRLVLNL